MNSAQREERPKLHLDMRKEVQGYNLKPLHHFSKLSFVCVCLTAELRSVLSPFAHPET